MTTTDDGGKPPVAPDIATLVQQELQRRDDEAKAKAALRADPKDFGEFVDKLGAQLVPAIADEIMARLGLGDDDGEPGDKPKGKPAGAGSGKPPASSFARWWNGQ